MTLSENHSAVKQFFRKAWRLQATFQTQSNVEIPCFVAAIMSGLPSVESGRLTLDSVVFEPDYLIALQSKCHLPPSYGKGYSLFAEGQQEVEALLTAALCDVVHFIFVPKPTTFGIYSDHHGYATFYAMTRSNLNCVTKALSSRDFEIVHDFERNGPG